MRNERKLSGKNALQRQDKTEKRDNRGFFPIKLKKGQLKNWPFQYLSLTILTTIQKNSPTPLSAI